MIYYILFMCFNIQTTGFQDGFQVCSSAQFPDLKQCQYSASKIKKLTKKSSLWCQEVRK